MEIITSQASVGLNAGAYCGVWEGLVRNENMTEQT